MEDFQGRSVEAFLRSREAAYRRSHFCDLVRYAEHHTEFLSTRSQILDFWLVGIRERKRNKNIQDLIANDALKALFRLREQGIEIEGAEEIWKLGLQFGELDHQMALPRELTAYSKKQYEAACKATECQWLELERRVLALLMAD